MQTAPDSIVIWISQSDPTRPGLIFQRNESHYITDSHGCRFDSNHRTINKGAAGWVTAAAFEGFPRGDETFDYFISIGSGNALARFKITNPFKVAPARWIAQRLPITKTNGDFVVELCALDSFSYPQAPFDPHIRVINWPDAPFWDNQLVRIFDPFGKIPTRGFCTNNPLWKIEADFFRNLSAQFRPDEILLITNVAIPPRDGITYLQRSKALQGCLIAVDSLHGSDYVEQGRRSIGLDGPALIIWSQQRPGETKLMVRARDDVGRTLVIGTQDQVPARVRQPLNQEQRLFEIQAWPDSKFLNIEVIIQKPVRFEFFVETKGIPVSSISEVQRLDPGP